MAFSAVVLPKVKKKKKRHLTEYRDKEAHFVNRAKSPKLSQAGFGKEESNRFYIQPHAASGNTQALL